MTSRALVFIGVLSCLSGCGQVEVIGTEDGGDGGGDAVPSDVAGAFTRACGTPGCHVAGAQEPVLNDPTADSLFTGGLVTRGDLQGSRIAVKMLGLPGLTGGIMPPPSNPADPDDLALIIAWIAGLETDGGDDDGGDTGGSDGSPATDDGTPPDPSDCLQGATLSTPPTLDELWPMLEESCTAGTDGCHFSQVPVLSDATTAHANLIDVASAGGLTYVTPDSPDDSYLWHKVVGTHLEFGGDGLRMPLGPPLCTDGVVGLYAWILGGATP